MSCFYYSYLFFSRNVYYQWRGRCVKQIRRVWPEDMRWLGSMIQKLELHFHGHPTTTLNKWLLLEYNINSTTITIMNRNSRWCCYLRVWGKFRVGSSRYWNIYSVCPDHGPIHTRTQLLLLSNKNICNQLYHGDLYENSRNTLTYFYENTLKSAQQKFVI